MKDINGNTVSTGDKVCLLQAGNFIYGTVTYISESSIASIEPDIGYWTTKPNFRLKKEYKGETENIALIVDENR